ncbi:MAG: aminopeptidase P family protein [bacterium]|nr:aminopeptidase P family protein [bacterium]
MKITAHWILLASLLVGGTNAQSKNTKAPSFQGTALAGSMAQKANGQPICGLGKGFHAGRRAELRRRLKPGLVVLRGLPKVADYRAFTQDKNFWYLTGVESPDVSFLMDVQTGKEILFVNKPSSFSEQWAGEIWDTDDDWIRELTGVQDLRRQRDLGDAIEELLDEGEVLYTVQTAAVALAGCYDAAEPYARARTMDKFDGRLSREGALKAKLKERFGVEVEDITRTLRDMRQIKQPQEIEALRSASRAGALAMKEGIRSTRVGLGEWEIASLISWVQRRYGAAGDAYAAIVGSGANSLVLHYQDSTRTMGDGEVLLVDFGPEVDHYVTDITRTWPVNGKFTKRQAELYDAVLAAQIAGIAAAKPGGSLRSVDVACSQVLKDRGFSEFMAHSAVHWVGMEVHDPGVRGAKLKPGMVFTIEPGLYEQATGIGIRIEDVVAITKDGCEVLTRDCPKDREAIEALFGESGVLDLMDKASE